MTARIRYQMHLAGCCQQCDGTGTSGDSAVPGGLCWDCRATGHAHAPTRLLLWQVERRYRTAERWLTERPFDVHLDGIHDEYARTIASLDAGLTFGVAAA